MALINLGATQLPTALEQAIQMEKLHQLQTSQPSPGENIMAGLIKGLEGYAQYKINALTRERKADFWSEMQKPATERDKGVISAGLPLVSPAVQTMYARQQMEPTIAPEEVQAAGKRLNWKQEDIDVMQRASNERKKSMVSRSYGPRAQRKEKEPPQVKVSAANFDKRLDKVTEEEMGKDALNEFGYDTFRENLERGVSQLGSANDAISKVKKRIKFDNKLKRLTPGWWKRWSNTVNARREILNLIGDGAYTPAELNQKLLDSGWNEDEAAALSNIELTVEAAQFFFRKAKGNPAKAKKLTKMFGYKMPKPIESAPAQAQSTQNVPSAVSLLRQRGQAPSLIPQQFGATQRAI